MPEPKKIATIQVEVTYDQGIELLRWLGDEQNVTVHFRQFLDTHPVEQHFWVGIEGDNFKKVGGHFEVRLWISKEYTPFAAEKGRLRELLGLLGFKAPNHLIPAKEE